MHCNNASMVKKLQPISINARRVISPKKGWQWLRGSISPQLAFPLHRRLVALPIMSIKNFMAHRQVYRGVSALTVDHRVPPYLNEINYPVEGANQTLFHPLWAYEAIWNIITFVILWVLFNNHREKLHRGDIFLLYIIFYTPIRFLLEFLRVSPAYLPGTSLNSSQTITGLAFVVALLIFLYRHRPGTYLLSARICNQPLKSSSFSHIQNKSPDR